MNNKWLKYTAAVIAIYATLWALTWSWGRKDVKEHTYVILENIAKEQSYENGRWKWGPPKYVDYDPIEEYHIGRPVQPWGFVSKGRSPCPFVVINEYGGVFLPPEKAAVGWAMRTYWLWIFGLKVKVKEGVWWISD